jgi:hypothetical protein
MQILRPILMATISHMENFMLARPNTIAEFCRSMKFKYVFWFVEIVIGE